MNAAGLAIPDGAGAEMYGLVGELYPICRSITGEGIRRTLTALARWAPIVLHQVPTGTKVLDWTVPREWTIRDAWVADASGRKVIDFKESNLHLVNYSVPIRRTMTLAELRPRLFSIPEHPDWIPYRTSYYKEDWGFCLAHRKLQALAEGAYEVFIDSTLADGHLTYGEAFLPGETPDEVLISSHACHPSLCNDNLSGIVLSAYLARTLAAAPRRRLSYRFLYGPGAIGAITWLSRNQDKLGRIRHGLTLACIGDAGKMNYKKSRRGNAEIDIAVRHVLRHRGREYGVREFSPVGYDERQYCSPGFDLPVGSLTRTPNNAYPEYHTSADDLALVRPEALADSLSACLSVIHVLEANGRYQNLSPYGEPQLGKRGLYSAVGGRVAEPELQVAILWVLNLSDGSHSTLDIAERAGLPFALVQEAVEALLAHGLLEPVAAGA